MTALAQTASKSHETPEEFSALRMEYEQVNNNFRMLADIRFKLLALVPALGGAAIFVLSGFTLSQGATAPPHSIVLMIGVMGFLATLGITIYDQRNTELYENLIKRAKYLEGVLKLPPDRTIRNPGREFRGQFKERPRRGRYLLGFISMGHDRGLALIYGPVLGAWFFPIVYAGLQWGGWLQEEHRVPVALASAAAMTLVFIVEFLRLDSKWKGFAWARLWKWLWPHGDDDDSG
jgi:hypothetical protein